MKLEALLVGGVALICGATACAQEYAKVEVPVGYSYMHFNPENSHIVSGLSLNGGGGGVTVYINHFLGIQGEFEGYASLTKTFAFPATPSSPCPTGCNVRADGNLFTYNVGPVFKYRAQHFEPFIETMFGGAHSNTYQNLLKACQATCTTTNNPSNNAWDFVIGGGVDVPITKSIAFRPAQFDFILTRFGNSFTKGNLNQSNFRYQAGLAFRF